VEEEGAAACLLLADPKSRRTRGKEFFFSFRFLFCRSRLCEWVFAKTNCGSMMRRRRGIG